MGGWGRTKVDTGLGPWGPPGAAAMVATLGPGWHPSATFGTIIWLFHSCTPLGPFTSKADCYVRVCPVTPPKQIQTNPCAIELLVYNCTGFGIEDQNLLCHLLRLTTCKYWTIDFIIIWITIITRFFNFFKYNKLLRSYSLYLCLEVWKLGSCSESRSALSRQGI